jgi:hypothetical protein
MRLPENLPAVEVRLLRAIAIVEQASNIATASLRHVIAAGARRHQVAEVQVAVLALEKALGCQRAREQMALDREETPVMGRPRRKESVTA